MVKKLFLFVILVFLLLFIGKSFNHMVNIPFHDFDEAHRAEKAKRMKDYLSFLVPLTGSPQDRVSDLRVTFKENSNLHLYYHPERPPLVYWLMILSTNLFGNDEWVYRLPSLLMALLTIVIFVFFIRKYEKGDFISASIGLVCLLTSGDLWLSGQYAQLDTTLTFFTFLSLLSLIYYCQTQKHQLLVIAGISAALSVLSKGYPVVILIFPIITLFLTKKLKLKDFLGFVSYAAIILIPWVFFLNLYFGFSKVLQIFTEFGAYSAIIEFSYIKAPFFWYLRWWWDSFRPGWTLFLALLLLQAFKKKFNWMELTLLSYIIGGLLLFSLSVNKIWWYVLPLIPAVAYYIYIASREYLEKYQYGLVNLSTVIILVSLPIFRESINKITLIYGSILTTISFLIFKYQVKDFKFPQVNLLLLAIFIGLLMTYLYFPTIVPYHYNTKFAAQFYKSLPGRKCLYFYDMPPETALFYSDAGELIQLTENIDLFPRCRNYLISPADIPGVDLLYTYKGRTFNVKDRQIIFQKGSMKLLPLNPQFDP